MNSADHISQDDLALFALQMLSQDEAAIVLAHVRQCELCRTQVAEFQGDLALYSLSAGLETPPASAQERLLRSIAAEPRVDSATKPDAFRETRAKQIATMPTPARPRPRSTFIPYLGWALAAMFALAAGLQFEQSRRLKSEVASAQSEVAAVRNSAANSQAVLSTLADPHALSVTLRQPTANGTETSPQGRAAYLPDRGALVFVATNLEPLEPYKVYELWLLPVEKNALPIPAASFRPDASGNATVIVPAGPKLVQVKGFGVTREDDKSAPGKPTLPILLVGTSKS